MSHLSTVYPHLVRAARIFAIFLALALGAPTVAAQSSIELEIGGETYRIELALTSAQRRMGLMHRQHLDRRAGMLLVYRDSRNHRIWMKNVAFPLRVYWIDRDYRVVDMQRLPPCEADPCPVYSAPAASRYVLELSDHDHALEPGDRLPGLSNL